MSISLSKGRGISLTKAAPGLSIVQAGLGWDPRTTAGMAFDLDASALVCDANGRCIDESWFIFYNQLASPNNAIVHGGDNPDGSGEGDDEVITVTLAMIPPQAQRVVFAVSIHEGELRRQSFGQVQNSYIRILDTMSGTEIARYDLVEDFSNETSVVFGELVRSGSDWIFQAVGQGYPGGLGGLISHFGLSA